MKDVLTRRGPRRGDGSVWALDVGAYDVNGTYRPLVEGSGWRYTGLDVAAGPNVDVVTADPYKFPFDDGAFDVVLSGSTMEHVEAIWLWVPELARVLKPGGLLVLVDSLQMGDRPAWDGLLEAFPHRFHEPYFRHYAIDDLDALLSEAGLAAAATSTAFLAKIMVRRKNMP